MFKHGSKNLNGAGSIQFERQETIEITNLTVVRTYEYRKVCVRANQRWAYTRTLEGLCDKGKSLRSIRPVQNMRVLYVAEGVYWKQGVRGL